MPSTKRVLSAGLVSLVSSLLAAFVLAELGRAVFTVPREFDKFNFGGYGFLTTVGVIGAVIGWPLVNRVSSKPVWLYARAAVAVTVVLLLPDFYLFTQPGNPAGPVITLIVMHIAIAICTYFAMTRLAPPQQVAVSDREPSSLRV